MDLEEVRRRCANCGRCCLSDTCAGNIFGEGPENSEVMFVGEYPDIDDESLRRPLAGSCGTLLDCYLNVIGLYRDQNIYVTLLTKCRPPGSREPLPEERGVCIDWLREEFNVIRPKIVICAGHSVAQALIGRGFNFAWGHGRFISKGKTDFIAVSDPQTLLRHPQKKPDAFKGYMAIRERIGKICEHTYPPDFLLSFEQKRALAEASGKTTSQTSLPMQMSLVR